MKKEEILKELRTQFDLEKKRLEFRSTYEEIEELYFIEDMAPSKGFVSNRLSRQIITTWILEGLSSWIAELYVWVAPSPTDMIRVTENKILSQEDKKEVLEIIDYIMYLVRKNKRIAFQGFVKKEEADFIDELVSFSKKRFNPTMAKYNEKFENVWKNEMTKKKEVR